MRNRYSAAPFTPLITAQNEDRTASGSHPGNHPARPPGELCGPTRKTPDLVTESDPDPALFAVTHTSAQRHDPWRVSRSHCALGKAFDRVDTEPGRMPGRGGYQNLPSPGPGDIHRGRCGRATRIFRPRLEQGARAPGTDRKSVV